MKSMRGFSLLELLVVIGVLSILAALVFTAVNPARQFSIAQDTVRRSHIHQTLNALLQYAIEHNGAYPSQIQTGVWIDIGECDGCLKLKNDLVPMFIPEIPQDLSIQDLSSGRTGFVIGKEHSGQLTATATASEIVKPLTLTR